MPQRNNPMSAVQKKRTVSTTKKKGTTSSSKTSRTSKKEQMKHRTVMPVWIRNILAVVIIGCFSVVFYYFFIRPYAYRWKPCHGLKEYGVCIPDGYDIHGIDISKESYQTARRIHSDAIENESVKLRIGNVANLPYQNNDFDLVFAIQTHIFWEDLKQSFQEIYRVMSNPSTLIIASEKEKIKYHMTDYGTSHELMQLLTSIGFSKIEEKQNYKWVVYVVTKSD